MTDYKVFKDFTEEQDKMLRKWIKEGENCFVCGSKDITRIRGNVSCDNCGLKVFDFDYEPEPIGVL